MFGFFGISRNKQLELPIYLTSFNTVLTAWTVPYCTYGFPHTLLPNFDTALLGKNIKIFKETKFKLNSHIWGNFVGTLEI